MVTTWTRIGIVNNSKNVVKMRCVTKDLSELLCAGPVKLKVWSCANFTRKVK